MYSDFSSNLKRLRKEKKITLDELASDINQKIGANFNKGMISKWENGHPAQLTSIRMLSSYYDLTIDEIMGFNSDVEKMYIPIFKSFSRGIDLYSKPNVIDYAFPLPGLDNHRFKKMFYLRTTGDHMNREYPNNSIVLVEKGATIKNGDNGVVLTADNKESVYKIKIQDNFITLIPSSFDISYLPKIIDMNKENVEIIGKVIGSIKYHV